VRQENTLALPRAELRIWATSFRCCVVLRDRLGFDEDTVSMLRRKRHVLRREIMRVIG